MLVYKSMHAVMSVTYYNVRSRHTYNILFVTLKTWGGHVINIYAIYYNHNVQHYQTAKMASSKLETMEK